jgi:hypothetical protein
MSRRTIPEGLTRPPERRREIEAVFEALGRSADSFVEAFNNNRE